MNVFGKWKAFVLTTALLGVCSSARATNSITITFPANNAEIHCTKIVQVSVTVDAPGGQAGSPTLYIVDAFGQSTSWSMTPSPYTWTWSTIGSGGRSWANGTYDLHATIPYYDGQGGSGTLTSPTITVIVKNGYMVNSTGTATVLLPTNGQNIPTNAQNITITSTHTVTWNRYDDCARWSPRYIFTLETTYGASIGQTVRVDTADTTYTLPLQTGPFPYSGNLSKTIPGNPVLGSYQNFATTSGQHDHMDGTMSQVANDAKTFNVVNP